VSSRPEPAAEQGAVEAHRVLPSSLAPVYYPRGERRKWTASGDDPATICLEPSANDSTARWTVRISPGAGVSAGREDATVKAGRAPR
jgi:hypothetical protein